MKPETPLPAARTLRPIGVIHSPFTGAEGTPIQPAHARDAVGEAVVADLDVLDATPLLDIKPCVPEFDAHPGSRAGWLDACGVDRRTADGRFHEADPKSEERP